MIIIELIIVNKCEERLRKELEISPLTCDELLHITDRTTNMIGWCVFQTCLVNYMCCYTCSTCISYYNQHTHVSGISRLIR